MNTATSNAIDEMDNAVPLAQIPDDPTVPEHIAKSIGDSDYIDVGRIDGDTIPVSNDLPIESDPARQGKVIVIGDDKKNPTAVIHGIPTDRDGLELLPPKNRNDELLSRLEIDDQPGILKMKDGETPPPGYKQINRADRRALASRLRRAARRRSKAMRR